MQFVNMDIYNYLNTLGIRHANIGYRYLTTAIYIGIESSDKYRKMEDLYSHIAEKYGTTASAVERSIRYSLSASKEDGAFVPRNKEFITNAVDYLTQKNAC